MSLLAGAALARCCREKVENLNPESRVHWPQQYQQSAASARAGKLLLRSKIKAFDWETMPWFDDVGSHYCGQCLLDEDLKWWLEWSGHSCQQSYRLISSNILVVLKLLTILKTAWTSQHFPVGKIWSNEWFYDPARANDDRIQNWPEKKLVIDKIAQRVIEQIQSHSLSLMHSHIFCDFLLQN